MKSAYLKELKRKIAQYNRMKDLIELREKDIEFHKAQIGYSEDELLCERRQRNIKELEIEIMELEKDRESLKKAFMHLDTVAYKIIEMQYIRKEGWVKASIVTGYSQSRCKSIGKESLEVIGEYVFGSSIYQDTVNL